MKTRILLVVLSLALMIGGRADAVTTTTKLVFWMSSYFSDESYSFFLPLQGHTAALSGQANNSDVNTIAFPWTGTFTQMVVSTNAIDPGVCAGCTRILSIAIDGSTTAATCSVVPNLGVGAGKCTWSGSVAVVPGNQITLKFEKTGTPNLDSPVSAIVVFSFTSTTAGTGSRNWPFAS